MEPWACVSILFMTILGLMTSSSAQTMFDVGGFGAVGDGQNDDVKAFESTWKAACEAELENATITVPSGKNFLVSQIVFQGPCKSSQINFMISGTILAPPKEKWLNKSSDEWLCFLHIDGLLVDGNNKGTIDGRGESWWNINDVDNSSRPTALRFYGCKNLQVRGLSHRNSQKNHVSLNYCNNADVGNLRIEAPHESPNTDGIDISSSNHLNIHNIVMATGDDCIAINGGTSKVVISNVTCGPGHGISIGSLGKNGLNEEVSQITVTGCTFKRTQNGLRIKTWQGGSGFAKDIVFSRIEFIEANNPVIIDQYYCPHKECAEQESAVKISNVLYSELHGTSVSKENSISLSCSKTVSCDNIVLEDFDIRPARPDIPNKVKCINVNGVALRTQNPVVGCCLAGGINIY